MNSILLAVAPLIVGGGLINILVWLIVLCIVCAILWWILNLLPLPSPWKQIISALFALIILLVVLSRLGFIV